MLRPGYPGLLILALQGIVWVLPDKQHFGGKACEFEAESVSYLVCRRASLDTPAVEYLHGYLHSNAEVPAIRLEQAFTAAERVERMSTRTHKPSTRGTEDR